MKFYQVLLAILFTFLAMECQAGPKSCKIPLSAILEENSGSSLNRVRVSYFLDKKIKDFDLENTGIKDFTTLKQDIFIKALFNDDRTRTLFTYAILEKATRLATGKTKTRAATLFAAIQTESETLTALEGLPNRVIIIDTKQGELDSIVGLPQTIVESIMQQLGLTATSALSADSSNVTVRGRGKKPKCPPPLSSVAPIKTAEEIEQGNINARWSSFRVSGYVDLLRQEGESILSFTSGMKASEFIKRPSTLVDAEERIRATTELYQQKLQDNISLVRSLRTQIETASMTVKEVDDMLIELGYDVPSLTSLDAIERVKEAMLALRSEGSDFEAALAKNTKTMNSLRAEIKAEKSRNN